MNIHAPLIELSKADIIRRGMALGVDYAATISCYQPDTQGRACGRCDSCRLRACGIRGGGNPRSHALQMKGRRGSGIIRAPEVGR